MTQYEQKDEPVEVELENANVLSAAGFPLVEGIKAFAVSVPGEARLDKVEFEDAHGNRVEISASDRDPFMRALYAEIMKEALRDSVTQSFQDKIWHQREGARESAKAQAYEFRAGA